MRDSKHYSILAVDEGTTSVRAFLYDASGHIAASSQKEISLFTPHPGWVEQDASEISSTTAQVIRKSLSSSRSKNLEAIGITNQRETVVLWDRKTGKPVHPAIVWQDRRTADWCFQHKKKLETKIRKKTGLFLDPYFSATKLSWIFEHHSKLRKKAQGGDILFGTMDTWVLWNLTGGKSHKTDVTNASRTLLYDIHKQCWDTELLELFGIPRQVLPEVQLSGSDFGTTYKQAGIPSGIPITAMIGDQQAALYGESLTEPGGLKNTYGTGCFVVINMGTQRPKNPEGLLLTLACDLNGKPVYALEGSIFVGGSAIQWLRDGLELINHAKESEKEALKVKSSGGVVFVPALTGLGAPYWNPSARGSIVGLTRGTTKQHLIRATLEGIAQQCADVVDAMKKQLSYPIKVFRVDGGATRNSFLMQFQADLLGINVEVIDRAEATAWGAAKLAARTKGLWKDKKYESIKVSRVFRPHIKPHERQELRTAWQKALNPLICSAQS